jgi:hypothetical protein
MDYCGLLLPGALRDVIFFIFFAKYIVDLLGKTLRVVLAPPFHLVGSTPGCKVSIDDASSTGRGAWSFFATLQPKE